MVDLYLLGYGKNVIDYNNDLSCIKRVIGVMLGDRIDLVVKGKSPYDKSGKNIFTTPEPSLVVFGPSEEVNEVAKVVSYKKHELSVKKLIKGCGGVIDF